MSDKELIERLAKEHGLAFSESYRSVIPKGRVEYVFTSIEHLEAFAKAYQAAAPINNVAEALEYVESVGGTMRCELCGNEHPHDHTPYEIGIFNNGKKSALRNNI
jgi:nitroimidazol reductase NimA-like FMN-containing flavoprotein (pyridoxamine 5'-phosphate oxidase superfamily)